MSFTYSCFHFIVTVPLGKSVGKTFKQTSPKLSIELIEVTSPVDMIYEFHL